MKRLAVSLLLIMLLAMLVGCEREPVSQEYPNFSSDRIITYKHRKPGEERDMAAVILFEYEMDNYG